MARTYGIDQRRSAADTTSSMRCGANRVGHDNLKQTRTQKRESTRSLIERIEFLSEAKLEDEELKTDTPFHVEDRCV